MNRNLEAYKLHSLTEIALGEIYREIVITKNLKVMKNEINKLVEICHSDSVKAGWHTDITTGQRVDSNRGEKLMLIVSELAEAMEGERKGLMDDHLPHRKMAEVELADAVIRIADYCGMCGYDLGGAIVEKLDYNRHRPDHKIENRLKDSGKKF